MSNQRLLSLLATGLLLLSTSFVHAFGLGDLVDKVAEGVEKTKDAVVDTVSGPDDQPAEKSNQPAQASRVGENEGAFDTPVVPNKYMKGRFVKSPYPDMRGDSRKWQGVTKVSIPRYFVFFDKKAGQSASASAGWTGPTANTHVHAVLQGVDQETLQEITNKGYQDSKTKLAATGYQVWGVEELKNTNEYQTWDTGSYPDIDSASAKFVAKGMRDFSMFKQYFRHGNLMNETQAALVEPKIMVNFAAFGKQTSSHVGFQQSTASAEVSMGPSVHANASLFGSTLKTCDKHGQCFGDVINIQTGQPVYSVKPFGTIRDTTSSAVKVVQGVTNALAMVSGTSTRSDSEKTVYADSKAFKEAALEVIYETNTRLINKLLEGTDS
ncbi:MAG: hypothetical protein OQK12_16545 [Motiliproteus sp.]|nr:hypothetical protein [Motiliproteus sp.]MCW9051484.1 hypothetical protein [Motiliproteus sp.]